MQFMARLANKRCSPQGYPSVKGHFSQRHLDVSKMDSDCHLFPLHMVAGKGCAIESALGEGQTYFSLATKMSSGGQNDW